MTRTQEERICMLGTDVTPAQEAEVLSSIIMYLGTTEVRREHWQSDPDSVHERSSDK